MFIGGTTLIVRIAREAGRHFAGNLFATGENCLKTQQGVVKGYARRGDQAPVRDPATRSPARSDGLPKGCRTQKFGRAKRAEKFRALLKKN